MSTIAINEWIKNQLNSETADDQELLGITPANIPVKVPMGGIVKTADIINDLTTGGATKVLSAEQGVEVKSLIDGKVAKAGDTMTGNLLFSGARSIMSSTADPLILGTNNTERMRINASGNVGIGTSSPGDKLDVAGSTRVRGDSSNATFTSAGQIALKRSNDSPFISFHNNNGSRTSYIQASDGEIAIVAETNKLIKLLTNNAERLRITSTGNVGIGTTSPATALDVSGAIRTSTGILFGADTASANTLDDYEEGTWTPTISAINNLTSVVFSLGRYTKIGNIVTMTGKVIADVTSTSAETRLAITFPFNTANSDYTFAGHVGFFIGSGSNRIGSGMIVNPSSTTTLGVIFIAKRQLNATGAIDIRFTHTYQSS